VDHVNNDSWTALHYAIDSETENLDIVWVFIRGNANLNMQTNNDGYTPLMLAAMRGH